MIKYPFVLLFFLVFAKNILAGEVYKSYFSNTALGGYDPVSYYEPGGPIKGKKEFLFKYKDADWFFATLENKNKFVLAPEHYEPAFGGHCSNAVSEGIKVAGDPNIWLINKGRLHVFYSQKGLKTWQDGNIDELLARAEANWVKLKDK